MASTNEPVVNPDDRVPKYMAGEGAEPVVERMPRYMAGEVPSRST